MEAAAKWFDDFCAKLSDKASQSKQELEEAELAQAEEVINKKRKAAKSDKRQLDDFIRKYDDLIKWLNQ